MLGGVQAAEVECSTGVREMAQVRELGAVCARFGGTFESFRMLWSQRLSSRTANSPDADAAALPDAVPQTDWERRGATFERIYAVGRTVVGVRFTVGEILIVYK